MTVPHRRPLAERSSAARRLSLLLLSGLLATTSAPVGLRAQDAPVGRLEVSDPFDAPIAEAAQRFGIPASWIRVVMRAESAVDATAVSPKGAMGLMQIMPETWAELRRRHRLGDDPFDPRDNILAGAAYLRELNDRYGAPGLLAAYHAGPARYEAYLAGRQLPAETRAYVAMLTPAFGGGELPAPMATPAVDSQSWRAAPLFVSQPERAPSTDATTTAAPSGSDPHELMPGAAPALAPQPSGLFVALRDGGRRP
ncbi:lytic transglycosylase domain-containing protein [Xanthobacter versatilis]|uniref:lytic transglycosylase domain-containing protein n=1 Tax=Xanthobacter autotrophicus (strain ATCC BAA-1158 / Py2) TaxID=78245 RepID=UPI00372A6D8A